MNRLYITLLLALTALVCQGQNIRSNSASFKRDLRERNSPNIRPDIPVIKPTRQSRKPEGSQKPSKQDTVYATGTIKQHGWFAPNNIISKEASSHRFMSYRFTNKNKNGKWLKMEAINSYGEYYLGAMKPYILNNSDDSIANQEWADRIKTSCIYEFIADPTGLNVIQERAYDKDNNIVYAYSRTSIGEKNGKKMFVGSYKDCYGLPAEMRPEDGFSYGTLVLITEDKWGNDSIVEYIDSKGDKKLNAVLADKEYFIYDKDANLIMQQSRDSVGNLIIDKCGNCGILFTYDKRGNIQTATFMNEKWQPMYLPNNTNAEEKAGVQCIFFKYDEYDRQIEEKFVDINGMDKENSYGCHKITYEYDTKGNVVKQTGYDIEGRLCQFDAGGAAVIYNSYDDKGRIKESVFLDKNKKPNSTKEYISKLKKEYDEEGNEVLVENYSAETGEEKLCYQMVSKPNYKYTLWGDGTSRIDSLDSKGRTTFVGFYGADGKFEMTGGRAYERYNYIDQPGKTKQIQINYDQNGDFVEVSDFAKEETLVDSVNWTKTMWRYDNKSILKHVYIQRYTPRFEKFLGEDDANKLGVISRSGGNYWRYYKGNWMYNLKGEKFTHFYGIDEFGEPDYITSPYGTYYYSKSGKYYDINNKIISNNDSIMNALPKVMTIEVIDSSAYALGLRDNDIIITYGDYAVNLDSVVSYLTFKQEWTIRSVIDATKEKRMVVFRITDAPKNEYGLFEIKGLKGTCSELGFLPHIRLLTEKQINRIKESIRLEIGKDYPIISDSDLRKENYVKGNNMVLITYTELYQEIRNEPYGKEIKDPAILLGTCIADRQQKWTINNKSDTSPFEKILFSRFKSNNNYPIWNLYFTTDSKNIISLSLEKQNLTPINYNGKSYINWSDVYISDEDYRQISALYDNALDSINAIMKQRDLKNRKTFIGNWVSQPNDSLRYAPKAFFSLSKDGKFEGQIVNYGKIHYDYGDYIFKIVNRCSGTWLSSGSWLFFNPDEEDISLTCIGLLGEKEENEKHILNNYMNNICKTNKKNILRLIQYDDNKIDVDFYDVSINKNTFEAKLPSGKTIVFNKTKEKIDILDEAPGAENDDMSGEEINAIDESCPYIGSWQCKLPGVEKSNVEFELSQSGNLEVDLFAVANQAMNDSCSVDIILDINVKGSWQPSEKGMRFNIDPEKLNIDTDFVLYGIDDSTKVKKLHVLREYFDSQKHEMGLSLLKGFMNEMVVTEVDTVKMVMNGNEFTRTPSQRVIVIGTVEAGTDYYLSKKGYKGLYIVLEWCGWNCRYGLDEFREEFNKQKDNKKHIMLLPVETKGGKDVFKDIIELDVPNGLLGIRLMDQNVGRLYYKYNVLNRYKEYKKSKEY